MKAVFLRAEHLRDLLDYDPETGVFCWRNAAGRNGRIPAGTIAGYGSSDGHLQIRIGGRSFFLHRLAWLYVHGRWPAHQIDHRDGNPANNALSNLREATHAQNKWNEKARRCDGRKGVRRLGRRWQAAIRIGGGHRLHLGTFDTADQAHAAYAAAALVHHGEFARLA